MNKKIICSHRWMSLGIGDRGEPFIHIDRDGVFVVPITENRETLMIVEPSITERELENRRVSGAKVGAFQVGGG